MCSAFKKSKDTCWEQPARKCRNGNARLAPGTSHCSHRKTVMVVSIMSWESPAHFWSCPAFGDITGMLRLPPWAALSFMWQRQCLVSPSCRCCCRLDSAYHPGEVVPAEVAMLPHQLCSKILIQPRALRCVWDWEAADCNLVSSWGGGIACAADGIPVCAVNIGLHGPA